MKENEGQQGVVQRRREKKEGAKVQKTKFFQTLREAK